MNTNNEFINAEAVDKPDVEERVKSLITVEQLPVITEQLQSFSAEITARANKIKGLEVSPETLKAAKKELADIRKIPKELESRRIEIKKQVLAPYQDFEAIYKSVMKPLNEAIDDVSTKIKTIENALKTQKYDEIKAYFDEFVSSCTVDLSFVRIDDVGLNVTLTARKKALKDQCLTFLEKVKCALSVIATQEHKDEILYYYKKHDSGCFLDANKAIINVTEKYRAMEEAKKREEAERAQRELAEQAAKANEAAFEPFTANVAQEVETPEGEEPQPAAQIENVEPTAESEKIMPLTFTIYGTMKQLKAAAKYIKDYLNKEDLRYE